MPKPTQQGFDVVLTTYQFNIMLLFLDRMNRVDTINHMGM